MVLPQLTVNIITSDANSEFRLQSNTPFHAVDDGEPYSPMMMTEEKQTDHELMIGIKQFKAKDKLAG